MNRTIKINQTFWLIVGIVSIIMILLLAYALSVPKPPAEPEAVPAVVKPAVFNPQAGLGEEGAECRGEMNLPCRPGLACLGAATEQTTGICTKATDKDPGRIEPPEELRSQTPGI